MLKLIIQIRTKTGIDISSISQLLVQCIKPFSASLLFILLMGCSKTVTTNDVVYNAKENMIVLSESQNEPYTGNVLCHNNNGLLIYELVINKGINITDNIEVNRNALCNTKKEPYEYYWDITDDSLNVFMKDFYIPFSGKVVFNANSDTIDVNMEANLEVNYQQGKKNGNTIYYSDNREIQGIISYEDNELNGETSWFYENGQLESKVNYKDGKINGEKNSFYENGQLKSKINYKDGEVIDKEVISYFDNGKIKSELKYNNGKLTGTGISYYINGQIQSKIEYKKGEFEGNWTYWKSNGDTLDSGKINNGNGIIRLYDDNYNLLSVLRFKNGEYDGLIESYYDNGLPHLVRNYKDGKLNGEYCRYYENNQLEVKATYFNGEYDGQVIRYDENGKIEESSNYKKGILHGKQLYYLPGVSLHESNYKNGIQDGWKICYKENGDILYKLFYVNGESDFQNQPKRVNPEIDKSIKYVKVKLERYKKDYKRDSKPYGAHVKAYFQFKNISKKKIAAIKFDFCFKDVFGDELYSGSVKYDLNLKAGETNPMDHYWYWEDSYSSPYDKLWSPVESGNVTTEVLVTKIVFSDGSILE